MIFAHCLHTYICILKILGLGGRAPLHPQQASTPLSWPLIVLRVWYRWVELENDSLIILNKIKGGEIQIDHN